jgi:hypothetical protein
MPVGLVQTVLPSKLVIRVKRLAKAEGLSVSAWLRRLIIAAAKRNP